MALAVRMTRTAISPRLAISTLENMRCPQILGYFFSLLTQEGLGESVSASCGANMRSGPRVTALSLTLSRAGEGTVMPLLAIRSCPAWQALLDKGHGAFLAFRALHRFGKLPGCVVQDGFQIRVSHFQHQLFGHSVGVRGAAFDLLQNLVELAFHLV